MSEDELWILKNWIDILLAKFDESQVINLDRKFRFLDIEIETKVKIQFHYLNIINIIYIVLNVFFFFFIFLRVACIREIDLNFS